MSELKPCPCNDCPTRKAYAKLFDMHIWGEDCPYVCEKYDEWKGGRTMSDLIDREAVRLARVPYDEQLSMYERGWNDACDAIADNAPAAPRWVRCEEPPKEEGRYLVASRWGKDNHWTYDLAYYTTKLEKCYFLEDGICGAGWHMWSGYEDCDIRVFPDYWMPIEPPREG